MKKEDLPVYKNNEELPLVLSTNDVAGYLNISPSMNSFFSGSIRRLEKYCKGGVFHEQKKCK